MKSWGNHNCGKSFWRNTKLPWSVAVNFLFLEGKLNKHGQFSNRFGITCLWPHLVTILFRPLDCAKPLIPLIMKTDNWLFCLLHPNSIATFNNHQTEVQRWGWQRGQSKKRDRIGRIQKSSRLKRTEGKKWTSNPKKKRGRIHEEKKEEVVQRRLQTF